MCRPPPLCVFPYVNSSSQRTELLNEAIARSLLELRFRLCDATCPAAPEPMLALVANGTAAEPTAPSGAPAPWTPPTGASAALEGNETAKTEVSTLVVELLTQHEVEVTMDADEVISELLALLHLSATQLRAGASSALSDSVAEWRRQRQAQLHVSELSSLLLGQLTDLAGAVAPEALEAAEPSAAALGGSPPARLEPLLEQILQAYELPITVKDADVVGELLKLANLEGTPLPTQLLWLESAVVDYRRRLASGGSLETAAEGSAGDATGESLIVPELGTLSAAKMLEGRAEAVTPTNFALLVTHVMQAVGVKSRLVLMCDDDAERVAAAAHAAAEADAEPPQRCDAFAEIRLGRSAKKVALWVAAHRKAQRASRKNVKGAKAPSPPPLPSPLPP